MKSKEIKKQKKIKTIIIIASILLIVASIVYLAIYFKMKKNEMKKQQDKINQETSILPNLIGKNLKEAKSELDKQNIDYVVAYKRLVTLSTKDTNSSDFSINKETIDNRLKSIGIKNYSIDLNNTTGDINLEFIENENLDTVLSDINQIGAFKIIDSYSQEVLINNNDIEKAEVVQENSNQDINLNVYFTKDGLDKFEKLKNIYNDDDNQFSVLIDDTTIMTSYLENYQKEYLALNLSNEIDSTKNNLISALNLAAIIENKTLTCQYEFSKNKNDDIWSASSNALVKKVVINNKDAQEGQAVLNKNSPNPDTIFLYANMDDFKLSTNEPVATIDVKDFGTIKVELYPEYAPNTVNNFIALANNGFYDGLTFHRTIPNFIIQGGDPNGDGTGNAKLFDIGQDGDEEYSINGEFLINNFYDNTLKHEKGVISMARSDYSDDSSITKEGYNSASCQFFIVTGDDNSNKLDGLYAGFGKVIEGMDIVEKIANVPVETRDENTNDTNLTADKPTSPPVINHINVETNGYKFESPKTKTKFDYELYLTQKYNSSKDKNDTKGYTSISKNEVLYLKNYSSYNSEKKKIIDIARSICEEYNTYDEPQEIKVWAADGFGRYLINIKNVNTYTGEWENLNRAIGYVKSEDKYYTNFSANLSLGYGNFGVEQAKSYLNWGKPLNSGSDF